MTTPAEVRRRPRGFPPVAGCGPVSLVAASVAAVVGSVGVQDWRVGVATLGVHLGLAPLAVGPWTRPALAAVARRVLPGVLAAATVGVSSWWLGDGDPATGVTAGLRVLTLVLPGAVLAGWLDPGELGDALAQQLRLPPRVAVAASIALTRVEGFGAQWRQVANARRARGLGPGRSPASQLRHVSALTFGVLVAAIRDSGRTAVAMDARGFAGNSDDARRRTWARQARWTLADSVLGGVAVLLLVTPSLIGILVGV
ncbi:MAG: energy-coupling factor transporter transmembrane component T family protein [Angustibacter sp.]